MTNDLVYHWTHGADSSIKMASDMRLSQFDLIGFPTGNGTLIDTGGTSGGSKWKVWYGVHEKYRVATPKWHSGFVIGYRVMIEHGTRCHMWYRAHDGWDMVPAECVRHCVKTRGVCSISQGGPTF